MGRLSLKDARALLAANGVGARAPIDLHRFLDILAPDPGGGGAHDVRDTEVQAPSLSAPEALGAGPPLPRQERRRLSVRALSPRAARA